MTSPLTEGGATVLAPPAAELLLCCTAVRGDAVTAARIAELAADGVDWEHLRRNALKHGVIPLLYQRLAALRPAGMPDDALARLRRDQQRNSIRSLAITAELIRLLQYMERGGVQAVPYKGPALAQHVYGNITVRQFGDLDILVRPRDVPRAKALLCNEGYLPDRWPRRHREREFIRRHHAQPFQSADGRVRLELHWDFTPRALDVSFDLEALWRRLERRPLGSADVLTLPAEDLLLVLCVHGAKHCWSRLKGIRDVAETIVAHPALDWEWVVDEAGAVGAQRILWLGLFLAAELLGAVLPPNVRSHIVEDPMVPRLAGDVRARLFRDDVRHAVSADAQLFYLQMRERMRERLPQAVRFVRTYTRERFTGGLDGGR
jgi:hypothetical protein